jgi:FkbM family methyltransferase
MKNAIVGYWKLFCKSGLQRTFWSFYTYYYTKQKLKTARKNGSFVVNTHDCMLNVIPDDDGLSSELLVFGHHEKDTTNFVAKYLKKNMVCLDIGANIGYYSTLYSKIVGKTGQVISIEPSPLNFEYLKKNLDIQNMGNFQIFNCACGDKSENVNFQIDRRGNKCFILTDKTEQLENSEIIRVPVRKIDDIVNEIKLDKIDFLKMDVEGYEWYAIEGGWNTIQKFKPTIQIEIHHKRLGSKKTIGILEKFKNEGYDVIYHDVDADDEGTFFDRKNSENFNIDDFIKMNMIKDYQRSFKLILEFIKN